MRINDVILKINYLQFKLLILITSNIYILYSLRLSLYDQILNLMISFGIFYHYLENKIKADKYVNLFQLGIAFTILMGVFYRSLWLHIGDNFVYLIFPLLLFILVLLSNNISFISIYSRPITLSLLFPVSKFLFIPLAILINPFSTFFTWLLLNAFGFSSVMKGQEIFYNNSGVNITFSCSGSGQIIFCLIAMIIFNYFFPLKSNSLLLIQLFISSIFTFIANVFRLFLLTIFSNTANVEGFSIFDYLHGGNGGLLFSFFSILCSCELYKRLYIDI